MAPRPLWGGGVNGARLTPMTLAARQGRRAPDGGKFGGGGLGRLRGGGGLWRRFRPPRVDSVDEANAGGEAELQGTSAGLGEARNGEGGRRLELGFRERAREE
jgi:hypothetical protein